MSWERIKTHIAVRENDRIAHLEAVDVYTVMQEGGLEFCGNNQGNLDDVFPDLYFSPVSKDSLIRLYSTGSDIELSVMADGTEVDFASGILLDQVICGDEWHYVANAEEVREILKAADIKDNGKISLSQYVSLIRNKLSNDLIRNEVNPDVLTKDLLYTAPDGLKADLYPYQKSGFAWMDYMLDTSHGCILGDEMGLGKTLQAIAIIERRKAEGKKCLVIAPVSLLDNWYNECSKFAPDIRVLVHHGSGRTGAPQGLDGYDVVVTSYGHVVTDNLLFCMKTWDLIILDEAQSIKNPKSTRTQRVKDIPADSRLAITGTPFENHVKDIWSLTDFVLPGYLGSESEFEETISDDLDGAKKLEPVLSAIMVRRLVKDVAQDLPEKVIIPQPLSMQEAEADAYELTRKEIEDSGMTALPMLQKLRMYCTHPEIYDDTVTGDPAGVSIKYQRCCEILEEIFSRGEKALIFTSYQKMFDIFTEDITSRFKVPVDCINGATPVEERQKKVDWFNRYNGGALLVLNPRAAGTGLNITSANHVIHYNLEWNPAVEDQASARAYRRGQKKTTFIYRLYYLGTVEEIINDRIDRKRDMAGVAVVGNTGEEADMQDIIDALKISPKEGKR